MVKPPMRQGDGRTLALPAGSTVTKLVDLHSMV